MGSATHIQGIPQRPGLASRRDFLAVRERDRERTADIREAIYIRPLGHGLHLVKNFCNDTQYRVGSRAGLVFSKGSKVLLASNTGHPGETILGEPPPDKRGGSIFGQSVSVRATGFGVTVAGRYIGIGVEASGTLEACYYADGTAGDVIATKAVTFAGTVNRVGLISYSPLAVIFDCDADLHVWNITTNTLAVVAPDPAAAGTNFAYGGNGWAYFSDSDAVSSAFDLWRVNSSGTLQNLSGTPDTTVTYVNGDILNYVYFDGSDAFTVIQDSGGGSLNNDSGVVQMSPSTQPAYIYNAAFLPGDPRTAWAPWKGGNRYGAGSLAYFDDFTNGALSILHAAPSATACYAANAALSGLISWLPNQAATAVCLYGNSGVATVSAAVLAAGTPLPTFTAVDPMPGSASQPSIMVSIT